MKKIVAWCIIFCLCFGIVEVPNVKAISDKIYTLRIQVQRQ